MGKGIHSIHTMAGGEVSPKVDARVDLSKYGSWLRQCQNMIPYKQGGLTRRPGTQFMAVVKPITGVFSQYAVRLMPFVFSPTTQFVLEFGNGYVRFYSNGAQVVLSSAPIWQTSSVYLPGSFVEDPGDSDNIYYSAGGVSGSSTQPHNDSANWVLQSIYEVPSPYQSGYTPSTTSMYSTDVFVVTPCQINDVIYLVHPDYPPYKLTRFGDEDWQMEQVVFLTPALLDQNATDTTITPSALTGNGITLTASAPAWVTATYYTAADSVLHGGIIYDCVVANVSGTFATDLANGLWEAVGIFNPLHVGADWQLATLRNTAYVEYDGTAADGFVAGTSNSIQCIGGYTFSSYGTWGGDIQLQQSLDNQLSWEPVTTETSRSDNNFSVKGTAAVLAWYRIVVSNVSAPPATGASNPRIIFQVDDAFLYGLVQIATVPIIGTSGGLTNGVTYQINALGSANWSSIGAGPNPYVGEIFVWNGTTVTGSNWSVFNPYICTANVVTQLTNNAPVAVYPAWVSGNAYYHNVTSDNFVVGNWYVITAVGNSAWTLYGAPQAAVGVTFQATGTGTVGGTGTANDLLSYAGINYQCIHTNTNSTTAPPSDPTDFAVFTPALVGSPYWSEGAWSNYRGFPQAITSYQQRVIYASSGFEPQRIWGTITNDLENFYLGDQTLVTDSFAFDLNAPSRGPIQWLIAQTDLFAGLSGAEWVINSGSQNQANAGSGAAIGPSNIDAFENGTFGSSSTQPAVVGNAVFFVQRQSTSIRQMLFSVYTAKYMSQDLTGLSDHLFQNGIYQIAYQNRWRSQGILWAITGSWGLCGLVYDLEQEVAGWFKCPTVQTNNANGAPTNFTSMAVIYGGTPNDDQLWLVANGCVQRMNPFNWETNITVINGQNQQFDNAYYVDNGKTFTNPGSLTLTGLTWLENQSVVGIAGGSPSIGYPGAFGPLTVSNTGTVTLPPSFQASVATVQIGLPIQYYAQPMRIDQDPMAGNTQARTKTLVDLYVRLYNSMGGSVSNGTFQYPMWTSGAQQNIGDNVISPLTSGAYQCTVAIAGGSNTIDPSAYPQQWTAGFAYATGTYVTYLQLVYYSLAPVTSQTPPNIDTTNWQYRYVNPFVSIPVPSYQPPVPIPYTPAGANPFAVPVPVTSPKDVRVTPQQMPTTAGDEGHDPQFIIQGNDALPLTILALIVKYDIVSNP